MSSEEDCIGTRKPSKRQVAEANVNELQTAFVCSLRKSAKQIARELSIPQSTVHKIMQNSCCNMYEPKTRKLGPHFSVMFFQNLKTIIFSQQECV